MSGALELAARHLAHRAAVAALLAVALGVTILLPLATRALTGDFERELDQRAAATPLVVGAPGNRFDLTLAALYFRENELQTLSTGQLALLSEPLPESSRQREPAQAAGDLVVPLHVRFSARGRPIVATTPEYFERRGLRAAAGSQPFWLGECALGASVAAQLELGPGDTLFSDAREAYDLAQAPPLEMIVSGVFDETGGPDDAAVFVTLDTAWILEGLLHGHAEAGQLDENLLFGKSDDEIVVGPALVAHWKVDPENRDQFHLHADPDSLPLTAALVFPRSAKTETMIRTRLNSSGELQALDPAAVVEDLVAHVFRIRRLFDLVAWILGAATTVLAVLVLALSLRLRADELATFARLGASRATVALAVGLEIALVLAVACALAAVALAALRAGAPSLLRLV